MKRIVQKETHACDKCRTEVSYPDTCLSCGTEMCYECSKIHGIKYNHAVYFQGSGDGFYCKPCNAKLTAAGNNNLHNAYRSIESLRIELKAWSEDFRKRQDRADEALKDLTG